MNFKNSFKKKKYSKNKKSKKNPKRASVAHVNANVFRKLSLGSLA
jgi:hypothetical protein